MVDDTVDTVSRFESAIAEVQQSPAVDKYIEVSQEVFDHFMQGKQTPYFMRGNPGVKVYVKGTREAIEAKEKRTTNDAFNN